MVDETISTNGDSPASGDRLRRPRLERSEPVRSFEQLYGGLLWGSDGAASGGSTFSDIARASIEAAYRVVDAQFEYGRQVAQQMGLTSPFTSMASPAPGIASQPALEALFKAYAAGFAELSTIWFKAMLQLTERPGQTPDRTGASAEAAGHPDSVPAEPSGKPDASAGSVATQAAAAQPRYRPFIPLSLRLGEHASAETPPLDGVDMTSLWASALKRRGSENDFLIAQVTSAPGRTSVRLSVTAPPTQQPGVYDGVISDPEGLVLGAVTVTVQAP